MAHIVIQYLTFRDKINLRLQKQGVLSNPLEPSCVQACRIHVICYFGKYTSHLLGAKTFAVPFIMKPVNRNMVVIYENLFCGQQVTTISMKIWTRKTLKSLWHHTTYLKILINMYTLLYNTQNTIASGLKNLNSEHLVYLLFIIIYHVDTLLSHCYCPSFDIIPHALRGSRTMYFVYFLMY